MSRPAAVYLAMICVLILGLWAVLEIGNNYLSAPEDLAGKWQIQSATDSVGTGGTGMNVEQSGKFFQVAFDHGPQLDLKLQSTSPTVLSNAEWKLTITGNGSDEKTVQLEGPQSGRWSAHRTVRTFPPDAPTTKEAK